VTTHAAPMLLATTVITTDDANTSIVASKPQRLQQFDVTGALRLITARPRSDRAKLAVAVGSSMLGAAASAIGSKARFGLVVVGFGIRAILQSLSTPNPHQSPLQQYHQYSITTLMPITTAT